MWMGKPLVLVVPVPVVSEINGWFRIRASVKYAEDFWSCFY